MALTLEDALRQIVQGLKDRLQRLETLQAIPCTIQRAIASASLTLTGAAQDVAGATLSLTAGKYLVQAVFDFKTGNDDLDNNQQAIGVLVVNAVTQGEQAILTLCRVAATSRIEACVTQVFNITVPSATTYVAKLQAYKSGGTGTSQAMITHSTITAVREAIIG